jgi:hypothetical protein
VRNWGKLRPIIVDAAAALVFRKKFRRVSICRNIDARPEKDNLTERESPAPMNRDRALSFLRLNEQVSSAAA